MVTLCATVLRASPATKPVRPERAPLDKPKISIGALTAADVMLTMRPKRWAIMVSSVALIKAIGVSMLASSAAIHASRSQSRKSPGLGPPALVTKISSAPHTANTAARPSGVVMSAGTVMTRAPVSRRIFSAAASSASAPRATMVTVAPSRASENAQARPKPLLAPQTKALRPDIARFMAVFREWFQRPHAAPPWV